ncbi:site-specific integrase [Fusibacter sp. JL216-2]|uniref:site-specific integrase n=1 Tax=Fusibacter sp. JL216-2 TaxID=3071453 RepID=UPI003D345556
MSTIKAFEDYLGQEGKSEKTIESYVGDVRGLEPFIQERVLNFDGTLNRFMIKSYKTVLIEEVYKPTTINRKVNSIASYSRFLIKIGYITNMDVDYKCYRIKIYGRCTE